MDRAAALPAAPGNEYDAYASKADLLAWVNSLLHLQLSRWAGGVATGGGSRGTWGGRGGLFSLRHSHPTTRTTHPMRAVLQRLSLLPDAGRVLCGRGRHQQGAAWARRDEHARRGTAPVHSLPAGVARHGNRMASCSLAHPEKWQ